MIISGRTSLMEFMAQQQDARGLTDRVLLRAAGLSPNSLGQIRKQPRRNVQLPTAIALVNTVGHVLIAAPEDTLPVPPPAMSRPLVKRLPELTAKLVDLRTSIENKRHTGDLRSEIDDILFWLEA